MTRLDFGRELAQSQELLRVACNVVPGGVHSGRRYFDPPFCVKRGSGAYIEDLDGNTYIDYQCGAGAVILGHAAPSVTAAVVKAMHAGVLFGVGTTEAEVQLAELIVRHVPSIEQVLFCGSGSEATFNAIRLARAVTQRELILKFQGCYHGSHDYVLRNGWSRAEQIGKRDPQSAGMLPAAVDSTIVCRFNDLADVEQTIARHGDRLAAVIVEPVAHNGPGILPKPGFLRGLRELCDQCGSLLIFDEILTGFRHHIGGFQAICGVMPDLTALGKAVANGYPFAALGGRRQYMERFTTTKTGDVVWAGTYNGNAIGVVAAVATIAVLEDGAVYRHLHDLGAMMRSGLEEISKDVSAPHCVCGYGSLFSLWFADGPIGSYDDVVRNDVNLFVRYRRELIARGVFEFPDIDGARSHISASHSHQDVDRTLSIAADALQAAQTRTSEA